MLRPPTTAPHRALPILALQHWLHSRRTDARQPAELVGTDHLYPAVRCRPLPLRLCVVAPVYQEKLVLLQAGHPSHLRQRCGAATRQVSSQEKHNQRPQGKA